MYVRCDVLKLSWPYFDILLVNKYELMCVEHMAQGRHAPDEEKMLVAFEALDALIPNLGVYTRIFKKLRDDLYGK